jgi:hypothetical protein
VEISSPGKDKLMRSNEMARSNDGNASSIGTEQKFATAKPKPWECEPYNYEVPTNAGSSLRCDPRRDYVEQNHGPHQDLDFTPSDDDGYHGSGYPAFDLGAMPDLNASASSASDQGTLAGGGRNPAGDYARGRMGERYNVYLDYCDLTRKKQETTQEQKAAVQVYRKHIREFYNRTGVPRWRASGRVSSGTHGMKHHAWISESVNGS